MKTEKRFLALLLVCAMFGTMTACKAGKKGNAFAVTTATTAMTTVTAETEVAPVMTTTERATAEMTIATETEMMVADRITTTTAQTTVTKKATAKTTAKTAATTAQATTTKKSPTKTTSRAVVTTTSKITTTRKTTVTTTTTTTKATTMTTKLPTRVYQCDYFSIEVPTCLDGYYEVDCGGGISLSLPYGEYEALALQISFHIGSTEWTYDDELCTTLSDKNNMRAFVVVADVDSDKGDVYGETDEEWQHNLKKAREFFAWKDFIISSFQWL